MKKDPLPAEFVAYIKRLLSDPRTCSVKQIWHGVILRWGFWLDGVSDNKLPGYDTCPKPTERTNLPNGWSYQRFNGLYKQARTASLQTRQSFTRIDCGADHPYGICPKCGKAHGHVLMQDGKPSTLITAH